jgi:predicted enzyme related to lactoylglutathione lyase
MGPKKGRVTGLGGVFFKSENRKHLMQWYNDPLGIQSDEYGHTFRWRHSDNPEKMGYTVWSIFDSNSRYLDPSAIDFMINFRVENIESLIDEFKEKGIKVIGEIEKFDYGKFAWIMDPDGHKIELWEPVDEVFTEMIAKSKT